MSQVLNRCARCGLPLAPGVTDCPRCAHFYRTVHAPVLPNTAAPKGPQKYSAKQWVIGFVAFAVVLLFTLVIQPALFPANYRSREGNLSQVKFGMTIPDVKTIMGEPDQSQDMQSTGMRMQMFYYTSNGRQVQIAFQNGFVESVNRY